MGRLDNPRVVHSADPFRGHTSDQFVLALHSPDRANIPLVVTFTGLGSDIWLVPFDDITLMFKVNSENTPAPIYSFRHLTPESSTSTSTSTSTK